MFNIDDNHVFWQHLPPESKTVSARLSLRRRRLIAWFGGRKQRIGLVLAIYLITWSIPLLAGQPMISVFAVIPLILVPPVGLLIYCLVWKDFHE